MTLAALWLLLAAGGAAPPPAPVPGEELRVLLMTAGTGSEIWERFGHNALFIEDRRTGITRGYDWGRFDFNQPYFVPRFVAGRMLYSTGTDPAELFLRAYAFQRRAVWLQELALTPAQRVALVAVLDSAVQPAWRDYPYDYFRDNCSTRLRDALDKVLGGAIRATLDTIATGQSYRFHTRRLTAEAGWIGIGMDYLLGAPADQPLTAWEASFLPLELKRYLWRITVPGADGKPKPLVLGEQTALQAMRPPDPPAPPARWPIFLLAGGTLGGVVAGGGVLARRGARWAALLVRGLGGAWGAVGGILGLILALMWTFTHHWAVRWNVHLLLLSPLGLGVAWALWRRPRHGERWAAAALGLAALGVVLALLPGSNQRQAEWFALALPMHAGVWWGAHALARQVGGRVTS